MISIRFCIRVLDTLYIVTQFAFTTYKSKIIEFKPKISVIFKHKTTDHFTSIGTNHFNLDFSSKLMFTLKYNLHHTILLKIKKKCFKICNQQTTCISEISLYDNKQPDNRDPPPKKKKVLQIRNPARLNIFIGWCHVFVFLDFSKMYFLRYSFMCSMLDIIAVSNICKTSISASN